MKELCPGWTLEMERGPQCLMARVRAPEIVDDEPVESFRPDHLADAIWEEMQRHFLSSLVLELTDLPLLRSNCIGELLKLRKQIEGRQGMLRLCGLSEQNEAVLRASRLAHVFAHYETPQDALLGEYKPRKPR